MNNYDDIIKLPHHVSKNHKQMSIEDRSAQFAPFAALVGYNAAIKEKSRLTNKKIELGEEELKELNEKLSIINKRIKDNLKVSVKYFIPDTKKSGGSYTTIKDKVKRIDNVYKIIYLDNYKICIEDIIKIEII